MADSKDDLTEQSTGDRIQGRRHGQSEFDYDEPNTSTSISYMEATSGPFPPPSMLHQYEQVLPGAADRIFSMAEKEQEAQIADRKAGRYAALSVAVLCLLASAFMSYTGDTVTASIVGGSTIVGLVSVFVLGRVLGRNRKAESPPEDEDT